MFMSSSVKMSLYLVFDFILEKIYLGIFLILYEVNVKFNVFVLTAEHSLKGLLARKTQG